MRRPGVLTALALLLPSGRALAHAPIENVSAFYNGMLHPLLVPAHLLAILVLGLLLGQRGLSAMRYGLALFVLGLGCGLAASGSLDSALLERCLLSAVLCCGLVVILALSWPPALASVPALLLGVLIGLDSPAELPGERERLLMLCGVWVSAGLLLLFASGISEQMRNPWQLIGLRVVGSWITAGALLVLVLELSRRLPHS